MTNLETKVLEIRDAGTYIGVLAIRMASDNPSQRAHLRRVGFPQDYPSIVVMRLNDQKATSDVYEWPSLTAGTRTMQVAHDYIQNNFETLNNGDVVDVEFILGERPTRKLSEVTHPL